MNPNKMSRLIDRHLFGVERRPCFLYDQTRYLGLLLSQCKARGLMPMIGTPYREGGIGKPDDTVWHAMIGDSDIRNGKMTSGVHPTSLNLALCEAVLRYYDAWDDGSTQ